MFRGAGASSWRTGGTWWHIQPSSTPRATRPWSSSTSHTRSACFPLPHSTSPIPQLLFGSDSKGIKSCLCPLGASGSQRHPEPPQLRQEEPLQQLQRQDRAALLQIQHQLSGEPVLLSDSAFERAWVGLGFFWWKHKSLPGLGASPQWGLASVPFLQTQTRLHKQSSLTSRGYGCEPWPMWLLPAGSQPASGKEGQLAVAG